MRVFALVAYTTHARNIDIFMRYDIFIVFFFDVVMWESGWIYLCQLEKCGLVIVLNIIIFLFAFVKTIADNSKNLPLAFVWFVNCIPIWFVNSSRFWLTVGINFPNYNQIAMKNLLVQFIFNIEKEADFSTRIKHFPYPCLLRLSFYQNTLSEQRSYQTDHSNLSSIANVWLNGKQPNRLFFLLIFQYERRLLDINCSNKKREKNKSNISEENNSN